MQRGSPFITQSYTHTIIAMSSYDSYDSYDSCGNATCDCQDCHDYHDCQDCNDCRLCQDYRDCHDSQTSIFDDAEQYYDFYNNIVCITHDERKKRRQKFKNKSPLKRSNYITHVHNIILDLAEEILSEWREKVVAAAYDSRSNVNIYEYSLGDRYKQIPIVLLMTGPRKDPKFFEKNGMFSVVDNVRREIECLGFRVIYKRVANGGNVINIDWKTGLFDVE